MPAQQLDLFTKNLPKRPYCSNLLQDGLRIRDAARALGHRYIQPNHPNSLLWLLYDIDRPTALDEITDDRDLPPPTILVQDPQTGRGHAFYGLEVPVHLNARSSPKAVRFSGAVDVALTHALDADPGYAGLIAKNPVHERWRTTAAGGVYSLGELAEHVDLSPHKDRRKNLPPVGLGRNCTLFDRLRSWAYRAIRQGWPDAERWRVAVLERARAYNDFSTPLHESEVRATAKSVAKWTHRNFNPEAFRALQSARGKRGGRPALGEPWEALGISRATYFRRKAQGAL